MSENSKNQLPLEFQKINKTEKVKTLERIIKFTSVKFYQSKNVEPENFYKPISKIISFKDE
jgi:hypothetical protein